MSGHDNHMLGDAKLPANYNPVQYDEEGNIRAYTRISLWEKCKQEPLVPIGVTLTVAALVGGISAFRRGDKRQSQMMMRYRVLAQAATLGFFAYYTFYKNPWRQV